MKLSIITVNLNNRDGLKKTIDSVVAQTFKDFEWIVIDGGSTDGSRELIEEYSEYFAYWCSEPDKGIYNAMNKGVAHAKGEYCQFLNSGDWLAGDTVLGAASKKISGCDVLFGDVDRYKCDNLVERAKYPRRLSFDDLFYGMISHNACFINTGLLRTTPYDENLTVVSDWKFFLQMMLRGKSFVHMDMCIVCYDMGGISETHPELMAQERRETLSDMSSLIVPVLVEQIEKTKIYLAHTSLDEFSSLCGRHRLLSKCIAAIILLMKAIRRSFYQCDDVRSKFLNKLI